MSPPVWHLQVNTLRQLKFNTAKSTRNFLHPSHPPSTSPRIPFLMNFPNIHPTAPDVTTMQMLPAPTQLYGTAPPPETQDSLGSSFSISDPAPRPENSAFPQPFNGLLSSSPPPFTKLLPSSLTWTRATDNAYSDACSPPIRSHCQLPRCPLALTKSPP